MQRRGFLQGLFATAAVATGAAAIPEAAKATPKPLTPADSLCTDRDTTEHYGIASIYMSTPMKPCMGDVVIDSLTNTARIYDGISWKEMV